MLLLALVMCATGILVALLPHLPAGMPYWAGLFLATLLYPLALARTFKLNRADYEFRILHWFPFAMAVLWIVFELIGSKAYILHILQLGFFFLWSLPLVALGICFLILFSVHVIRRRRVRIAFLSVFLALFTVGAVASEAMGWDSKIRRAVYPKDLPSSAALKDAYASVRTYLGILTGTSTGTGSSSSSSSVIAMASSVSSSRRGGIARSSSAVSSIRASSSSVSSPKSSAISSVSSSRVMPSSVSSSRPALVASSKPTSLPASGPETAAVLLSSLLALYMGTVHLRAKRRV